MEDDKTLIKQQQQEPQGELQDEEFRKEFECCICLIMASCMYFGVFRTEKDLRRILLPEIHDGKGSGEDPFRFRTSLQKKLKNLLNKEKKLLNLFRKDPSKSKEDLLYKPVVLGCGHISCFWCVFNTMSAFHESYCPVCRHPFNHFPSICQLMHFLLQKLYPEAYERRGKQVEEEEKEVGYFSPQFDNPLSGSQRVEESNILGNVHSKNLESCSSGVVQSSSLVNTSGTMLDYEVNITSPATSPKNVEATGNAAIQEYCTRDIDIGNGTHQKVSVSDLLCAACENLLFQPVVLNCGHVFCESCINIPADGISRCQICQSMHPKGFPSVCKILEHFLEEQYPEVYLQRRVTSLKLHDHQRAGQSSSTLSDDYLSCWAGQKVHYGVGCDCCGISPIIGERYRCKDCVEKIGFDLCGACNNAPFNITGRFNQQHKPEHKLELVPPGVLYRIDDDGAVFQEDLGNVTAAPIPEDPENGRSDVQNVSPAFVFSADSSVDPHDDLDGSALSDSMEE